MHAMTELDLERELMFLMEKRQDEAYPLSVGERLQELGGEPIWVAFASLHSLNPEPVIALARQVGLEAEITERLAMVARRSSQEAQSSWRGRSLDERIELDGRHRHEAIRRAMSAVAYIRSGLIARVAIAAPRAREHRATAPRRRAGAGRGSPGRSSDPDEPEPALRRRLAALLRRLRGAA